MLELPPLVVVGGCWWNADMVLEPGLTGEATMLVTAADSAIALGSGDVDVLATPRVVALAEAATVAAVRGQLAADRTSVGTHVEVDHLRPSWPGSTVVASAQLRTVDGSRLRFDVEVREGADVVAAGVVERAIVDRARFTR